MAVGTVASAIWKGGNGMSDLQGMVFRAWAVPMGEGVRCERDTKLRVGCGRGWERMAGGRVVESMIGPCWTLSNQGINIGSIFSLHKNDN